MIVVILGPLGAGKSTLVRRLMRSREPWTRFYGTSPLPIAYGSSDLIVVGNYEKTSRTRHGMGFLERDYAGFDHALALAMKQTKPVVMEGGFQRSERLRVGNGPDFVRRSTAIYMDVVGQATARLGRSHDAPQEFERHAIRAMLTMRELGGSARVTTSRAIALKTVCELLGVPVPLDQVEEDYR